MARTVARICVCLVLIEHASAAESGTPVQFSDVTKAAGIRFVHNKATKGTSTILEEAGPGLPAGRAAVEQVRHELDPP